MGVRYQNSISSCSVRSSSALFSLFLSAHVAVGNKNDATPEKKVVKTEDAQKFSEQIGVPLYETSAKENQNVEEVSIQA